MKTRPIAILVLALALLAPALTGCQSGSPPLTREAKVFYSFRTSWDTAFEAYKQVQKLDLQGKIKPDTMLEVNKAWVRYRMANQAAFKLAMQDWLAPVPANVLALRDELLKIIKDL